MTELEKSTFPDLPERRSRRRLGALQEQLQETVILHLKTTTPLLNGGVENRKVDTVDTVRVPSIRGQLRFWWRALVAHEYDTPQKLHEAELALWGGMEKEGSRASRVSLSVQKVSGRRQNNGDVKPEDRDFYALWTAQGQKKEKAPPAERLDPGLSFTLRVDGPKDSMAVLKKALKAWIWFGGLGSRTRRGLGSLTVTEDRSRWLPKNLSLAEFRRHLGEELFLGVSAAIEQDVCSLRGAVIYGKTTALRESKDAWENALHWLRDFRQSPAPPNSPSLRWYARTKRYGRSQWPEADKIRYQNGMRQMAQDGHNASPAWARAGFGLPIQMQFPNVRGLNDFFLLWQRRGKEGGNPQVMQRLASPLIVKALPLATGQFCPLALWLDRRFPEAGEVGLSSKASGPLDPKTLAAFDRLVSEEDSPRFLPLEEGRNEVQGHRLRTSFEAWLKKHNKAERIA